MIRKAGSLVSALLLLPVSVLADSDQSVFRSELAMVELSKPEKWGFQDPPEFAEHLTSFGLQGEDPENVIRTLVKEPLVAATRYPFSHDPLTPSFALQVAPVVGSKDITGRQVLAGRIREKRSTPVEFEVIEAPFEINIDGVAGGRCTLEYTLWSPGGLAVTVRVTTVLLVHSGHAYQLDFLDFKDGSKAIITNEIDQILGSLRFLPRPPN